MAIASYLAGLGASPGSLVLKTGIYFRPDPLENDPSGTLFARVVC